jgi:UDP-N-acetylmuramoyl-tripeptide--D-alanyl-D-alanine ligase
LPGLFDILEALTGIRPFSPGTAASHVFREASSHVFREAVIDSRKASPGTLFIALPGERLDGHDYVLDAYKGGSNLALLARDISADLARSGLDYLLIDLRKKAGTAAPTAVINEDLLGLKPSTMVCLLVENTLEALQSVAEFWRSRLSLRVIGVTGSVGKSTTKELIAEVLSQRFRTQRNPGNLNNEIGLPLSLLRLTPETERAVLEMGFYVPGEISLLCRLARPQVGVVTNVGTVHAERAGSRETIARGKAELVQSLPSAPDGVAILNYDDPMVRPMSEKTQATVFFYGIDPRADIWADKVEGLGLDGIRFQLHYKKESLFLHLPLIGRHSVHTALRAAAVGIVEGLTWQEIVDGLRSAQSQLRLIAVRGRNGALLLDDTYNASPESNLAALNLLNDLPGRKIAVLGDMLELGPYERRGHALVGLRAASVVNELVTVGDRGKQIAMAAQMGGLASAQIHIFEGTNDALVYLQDHLAAQDVVLVKGSHGMRMDRIVNALEEST